MADPIPPAPPAPPTPPAPPAPPPPVANWYDGQAGVDAELIGHIQNKGWNTKTPTEVALTAIKAHREAEKFIGAPADKLIRLPTDVADEKGWNDVWTKLGAPADKTGYDFTGIKDAAGVARTGPAIDFARDVAAELHLPKDVAARLADRFLKFDDGRATETAAVTTAKLNEQKAALEKNWGTNYAVNKVVAGETAKKLGVSQEAVSALENVIGYDKVMEMFRTIGAATGEARFVNDPANPAGNTVMSKDQAQARLTELKADDAYVKAYLAGDAAKVREMGALHTIISS